MEYRKLGTSSLEVSVVGLGTWAIGNDFWGSVNDEESIRAIQAALDGGINLIDTAPAYGAGHSEEVVGKAIKGRRETAIVATKCGIIRTKDDFVRNLKPESLYKEIDDSLRRLGVDVIDLWQIHWPDPNTPLERSLEAIHRIKEQGKFRFLGVSNFDVDRMEKTREVAEIVSLQPQYSLLERSIEEKILDYCRRTNVGVLGYGTLAGGILTGKFKKPPEFATGDNRANFYPYFHEPVFSEIRKLISVLEEIAAEREKSVAQVAINWTIRQPGVTTALVGAKNREQAGVNAGAGDFSLTDEELKRIDEAVGAVTLGS
jgi:aryl-alcohol dehydrogenase-like predicted oxidoreductase